jgi:hypothetical protein
MIQVSLIVVVVIGLAIDAFVHFDLASNFKYNKTSTLSEADLFRAEAVGAIVAALALVVRPRRWTAALAFVVAGGGAALVVLYRYVDVGAFGPIPNMYDPYWAPIGKTLSVWGEAVATFAALGLFLMLHANADRSGSTPDTAARAPQLSR